MWKLEKEINSKISKLVKKRQNDAREEQDLLQMILDSAKKCDSGDSFLPNSISRDIFIIDNCKNIFFAGYETTAITASWCLMLLSTHQEWQDRVRAEVLEVVGKDGNIDATMLKSLKMVCFSQPMYQVMCFNTLYFDLTILFRSYVILAQGSC